MLEVDTRPPLRGGLTFKKAALYPSMTEGPNLLGGEHRFKGGLSFGDDERRGRFDAGR